MQGTTAVCRVCPHPSIRARPSQPTRCTGRATVHIACSGCRNHSAGLVALPVVPGVLHGCVAASTFAAPIHLCSSHPAAVSPEPSSKMGKNAPGAAKPGCEYHTNSLASVQHRSQATRCHPARPIQTATRHRHCHWHTQPPHPPIVRGCNKDPGFRGRWLAQASEGVTSRRLDTTSKETRRPTVTHSHGDCETQGEALVAIREGSCAKPVCCHHTARVPWPPRQTRSTRTSNASLQPPSCRSKTSVPSQAARCRYRDPIGVQGTHDTSAIRRF